MKIFALIFSLLVSFPAWSLEITIARKNHLGFKKIDILVSENKKYYFNGQALGETLPPQILQSWQHVESFKALPQSSKICRAGFFNFERKASVKTETWSGCSQGVSYGDLIRHLENIRQYVRSK